MYTLRKVSKKCTVLIFSVILFLQVFYTFIYLDIFMHCNMLCFKIEGHLHKLNGNVLVIFCPVIIHFYLFICFTVYRCTIWDVKMLSLVRPGIFTAILKKKKKSKSHSKTFINIMDKLSEKNKSMANLLDPNGINK